MTSTFIEQLFKDEITEEVKELTRLRLVDGLNLGSRKNLKKSTIKLVLLLVREANPMEEFSKEEESVLRGISRQTLGRRERERKTLHIINH